MRRSVLPTGFIIAALSASVGLARANDWPQWRGPMRNGISAERLNWPAAGPRRAWSAQVGEGFSSVAVVGNRVYTAGNAGNKDTVWCLDAGSGRPVWQLSYPCGSGGGGYGGPRATPTVDGANVYTLSNDGRAFCINAATGRQVWTKDLKREVRAQDPQWGFAGSPLIQGGLVVYNVGTAGVGVDKMTGRVAWNSGGGQAGYSSPVPYSQGGRPAVALFVAPGAVSVDPATGRQNWPYRWDTSYGVNAADPISMGDSMFLSSNYGHGCALVRVGTGRPQVLWENRNMKNHFNSCVLVGGAIFGNDEGRLRCLDARTGAERWSQRGSMGKGGLIAADGKLIVLTERGELLIIAATPDRYNQLAQAQPLRGTCWTHPVLANGFLYCRSHEGELVCLDVRGR